jgi:hypothetical protein
MVGRGCQEEPDDEKFEKMWQQKTVAGGRDYQNKKKKNRRKIWAKWHSCLYANYLCNELWFSVYFFLFGGKNVQVRARVLNWLLPLLLLLLVDYLWRLSEMLWK